MVVLFLICGCTPIETINPAPHTDSLTPQVESTIYSISPSITPNNLQRYVYLARGENGVVYLADSISDDIIPVQLPSPEQQGVSLSPSGNMVAYWFDGQLFVYSIDNGENIKVPSEWHGSFQYGQLAWAPSGTTIATDCFPSDTYPISEVCLFDISSGQVSVLTNLTNYTNVFYSGVGVGSWSSESNQIAFSLKLAQEDSSFPQSVIFIIDLTTQQIKLLFDERNQSLYTKIGLPRISRDGSMILVDAKVNNQNYEIVLIETMTTNHYQITNTSRGDTKNPFWLDDNSFVTSLITPNGEEYSISCPIYSISGEIINFLNCQDKWYLIDIRSIE